MEGKIKDFDDLEAWKKGHQLVLEVYKITKDLGYLDLKTSENLIEMTNTTQRLINGLIRSIGNQK